MICADCRHLKTDTPLSRKTAALGFSVCALGICPRGGLDYYPLEFDHACSKHQKLVGSGLADRRKKLKFWTDYLLKTMGKK